MFADQWHITKSQQQSESITMNSDSAVWREEWMATSDESEHSLDSKNTPKLWGKTQVSTLSDSQWAHLIQRVS